MKGEPAPVVVLTGNDLNTEIPVPESQLLRAYAAFLLALEEDDSVPVDDSLSQALNAVGDAIGFL
ncbi:MAG: hypothetical protein AAF654_02090 [Myxococcota bacterium]